MPKSRGRVEEVTYKLVRGRASQLFNSAVALYLFVCMTVSTASSQELSADELVDMLRLDGATPSGVATRSVVLNTAGHDSGRVTFTSIHFEHDSAELTDDSTAQLIELGKALRDERLANEAFVIEGHADAFGDDAYNKALSFRRAGAVKYFLTANLGIEEARLEVIGRGEESPIADDPYDPENRRVEVINSKIYQR